MDVTFPPGIVKTQTGAVAEGRWVDCDHVRFVSGQPQKIGGWGRHFDGGQTIQLLGVPRSLHAYIGTSRIEVVGAGTEQKLYAIDLEGVVTDITPFRDSVSLSGPFTTTNGSTTVTVTDADHNASVGDFIHVSGASAAGGITIAGAYRIVSIVDDDNYTIVHSAPATSGATGGGTVAVDYEVAVGSADASEADGYGVGPYGQENYGTPRTLETFTLDPRYWSLDHYGNLLVAACPGNSIYFYDPDTNARATILTNAPTDVRFAFITEERFVFALCEDMLVKWPDVDDPTDWTPSLTNTANARRLAAGSKLVAGTVLGQSISLVWADTCLYVFQFIGGNYIYESRIAGENCGLVGPGAFSTVDGIAFWMSRNGFHMFAGPAVLPIPNQQDIKDYAFAQMDQETRVKTLCFFNARHREMWWVYPEAGMSEPTRYVAVNIDEWHWTAGTLERTAGCLQTGAAARPLLASTDGYIYEHERDDVNANGASLPWHLTSGLKHIPEAASSVDIFGFSPDFHIIVGSIELTIRARDRTQSTRIDEETVTIDSTTEMADLRVEGRYFDIELSQDDVDGNFRLGVPTLEVQQAGARR
jgi:hypothetical protein